MFRNHLTIVVRHISKHRAISFMNVAGLTIGMTCCLLIFLYMKTELSYDRHHADPGRIFRVVSDTNAETALDLFHKNQQKYTRGREIKIDRYESSIENFRRFDSRNTLARNPVLFVGSSSIVFWETAKSFPDLPLINRGFGGASLPEIMHYYDDVIKKHASSMLVVYCDIDVENGKSPSFAVNAFKALVGKVHEDFAGIPILILSMKPTLIDDFLGKDVRRNKILTNEQLKAYCDGQENLHYIDITNPMMDARGQLRADIFIRDGMHLNPLGYTL